MKPGVKTTEFWITSITNLVAMVFMSGVLSPEAVETSNNVLAAITAGLTNLGYVMSRGIAKKGGTSQ